LDFCDFISLLLLDPIVKTNILIHKNQIYQFDKRQN
jgi:hypothetical protein